MDRMGNGDLNDNLTVIGRDAKFKGELSFESNVRILGSFEGQITTPGRMEVLQGAQVKADIQAASITVEGDIMGNLAASDLVELKETARIQGDIRCGRLLVVDGASFVGHCEVGSEATGDQAQSREATLQAS